MNIPQYCDRPHPNDVGIKCDLIKDHDGKHCAYDISMHNKDVEWDDATPTDPDAWYIKRTGLYACCITFLIQYISAPAAKNLTDGTRIYCPDCGASIKLHKRTWEWSGWGPKSVVRD